MILDSSAVVAVLQGEPEAERFALLIEDAEGVAISAATVVELSLVLGAARQDVLDEFLAEAGAEVVAVDADQVALARHAGVAFGRGSGSPARLNYGDCFSYALAVARGEPLLCKGDDFHHTDVALADPPPA